jgi:hypothetical protein
MKVKELIQHLLKADPNAEVTMTSDNFELNHSIVSTSGIREFNGRLEKRTFRDGFDNETYQKEIIVWDDKGKQKFVQVR